MKKYEKTIDDLIFMGYLDTYNAPYQASGSIFVRKIANTANLGTNEIPKMLNHRKIYQTKQ
jgi:hypothetical protein